MTNTFYNTACHTQHMMDPWSSGYDVSLTRRRSPVRLRVGPLLTLITVLLAGCGPVVPAATLDIELGSEDITSGSNTTLTVTATNTGEEALNGEIRVVTDGDNKVNVTHPSPDVLTTTLYADESVTRQFTVSGITTTRRTDYELTASYQNTTANHSQASTVLSIIK